MVIIGSPTASATHPPSGHRPPYGMRDEIRGEHPMAGFLTNHRDRFHPALPG